MNRNDTVIVVGAGPAGLVAACELARRGVALRVIDKLTAPTTESRAIAVHARSLEMLDRMGLAGELIDSGVTANRMEMHSAGKRLAHVDFGLVDSPFPFTAVTAQTETERILTTRLAALGVSVERGTELTGLTQDDGGAHLTLRHADGADGADGADEAASVGWVVGTDGAHSTVRRLVGTRLDGSFQGERYLLGDVEADHQLDRSSMYTFLSPDGLLAVFPMRESRMRLIAQLTQAPGGLPGSEPTQEELQRIADARAGGITITQSHWLTEFEIHHAQVPAYRFGRVFLAGDAAHVHSPAGGQGMNTGMQDAYNLAWKLALATRGKAGDALLDSYHAERHPVGAQVIAQTTRLTSLSAVDGDLRQKLRNELMHAALGIPPLRAAMARQAEEVTVAYRDSPVVTGGRHGHGALAGGDHAPAVASPVLRRQLDAAWAARPCGHLVLTIAPGHLPVPPAAGAGEAVQVLVTDDGAAVPGYDAAIADQEAEVAIRFGLPEGGRVAIRPDGYIGLVAALDGDAAEYFARLAR